MNGIFNDIQALIDSTRKYAHALLHWDAEFTSDDYNYFESINIQSNLHRMLLYIALVTLTQISNFAVDSLTHPHGEYGALYNQLYILMIVVCCIYSVAALCLKKSASMNKKKILYLSFWLVMMALVMMFSILDILSGQTLTNYFTLLVSVCVIPILKPKERFFIYFITLSLQVSVLLFTGKEMFLLQHSIVFTIGSAVVSQVLFIAYVKTKMAEKKLKTHAFTDALTSLPNRRGLDEWLERHCPQNENCRVAVGMIDIDHFKLFNDQYGHLSGDEFLKIVASCLKEIFHEESDIVCRYGGEEFLVILKNISKSDALNHFLLAKTTIEHQYIHSRFHIARLKTTVSIGVTFAQIDSLTNFANVLHKADKALYTAKECGRNLVVSDDGKVIH